MIRIEDMKKIYGKGRSSFQALRGLSMEINKGEFAAVTGESGSGKSTLLSIIGCMNTPSSGTVKIDGVNIYEMNNDERSLFRNMKVGFVFQSFFLVPYLTVEENVMVPLAPLKISSNDKRSMAGEAMESVGIYSRKNNLPGEISGGEMERAAIARAIVNNPEILLADEPTGNLDSKNGEVVMKLFSKMHNKGMTILMVTHSREYASYAERIMVMADGLIIKG